MKKKDLEQPIINEYEMKNDFKKELHFDQLSEEKKKRIRGLNDQSIELNLFLC